MKTTVVGGCGFIGSHLVKRLCKDGHRVHVVDVSGRPSLGVSYFGRGMQKWLREPRGKYGFMLVGHGSWKGFNKSPRRATGLNVGGVDMITKFARESKGGFMCVSDVARCGRNFQPWGFYIASKRLGEECAKHSIGQGVRGHILRLYPTYGLGMTGGRLVSDLIASAKSGDDMVLYGDGSEKVAPVHVLDVVEAMVMCMEHEAVAMPMVVGGDTLLTVGELAEMIRGLIGSTSEIVCVEIDKEPNFHSRAEKAKVLDWKPKIGLEDGLKELL